MKYSVPVVEGAIVPPSGGSLEIGNFHRNWNGGKLFQVPPSGGSLEIGNGKDWNLPKIKKAVPPSGGSLEIGNCPLTLLKCQLFVVPPSGGSLEIGNTWVCLGEVS